MKGWGLGCCLVATRLSLLLQQLAHADMLLAAEQAYYLAAPFAVERAPTQGLQGFKRRRDVEVAQLMEYPVRGLVFEAGESLTAMAELVGAACKRLQVQHAAYASQMPAGP